MDKAPLMKAQRTREDLLSQVLRLPWRTVKSLDGTRDRSLPEKQLILCELEDPAMPVLVAEVSSGLGPHIVQAHNELIKRHDLLLKQGREVGGTLA